ncbi:hypothetical protein GF386_02270 [Candidatus Pacearchaeota archaeon]|nr:hypothetical protein [Candidatus Pacearchaeota archaeon]
MVSEKLIIVLITLAILLSAVSIAVTVSSVNSKMIPEPPQINYAEPIPDSDKAQIGLEISGSRGG